MPPDRAALPRQFAMTPREFGVFVQRWLDDEGGTRCIHSKHDPECLCCIVHRAWYSGRTAGQAEVSRAS